MAFLEEFDPWGYVLRNAPCPWPLSISLFPSYHEISSYAVHSLFCHGAWLQNDSTSLQWTETSEPELTALNGFFYVLVTAMIGLICSKAGRPLGSGQPLAPNAVFSLVQAAT